MNNKITIGIVLAIAVATLAAPAQDPGAPAPGDGPQGGPGRDGRRPPIITALDANGDGTVDAREIAGAPAALKKLDMNGDGKLAAEEYRPAPPGGPGGPVGPGGRPGVQSDGGPPETTRSSADPAPQPVTRAASGSRPYTIVGTGQLRCFGDRAEIPPPQPGQPFHGQDAQFPGRPFNYTASADGLTVYDHNTGLTWQRGPDTDGDGSLTRSDKLTCAQSQARPATLNAAGFGGFKDWRLPTIKELYSLMNFGGVDPSGPGSESAHLSPFIDTKFFNFVYGDVSKGERIIDSQYASSTMYVGQSYKGHDKLFGLNLADGRIKGYDLRMPGGRAEKTFFVQCVRGNPGYGRNDFHDNGNGTITDRATGLMWSKGDSGRGMNWEAALAWVQAKNKERHLGHNDWRLPNAKELQSIVDYARSPDATGSPAIDPLFNCTRITNEIGQADYPYYWTGTTHATAVAGGAAVYIAFGRGAGWPSGMPGPGGGPRQAGASGSGNHKFVDVHGAGAQRSDPKTGDPAAFPHGRGPQGDVIRINNYIRCVRTEARIDGSGN